jgi:hypothetical protein
LFGPLEILIGLSLLLHWFEWEFRNTFYHTLLPPHVVTYYLGLHQPRNQNYFPPKPMPNFCMGINYPPTQRRHVK